MGQCIFLGGSSSTLSFLRLLGQENLISRFDILRTLPSSHIQALLPLWLTISSPADVGKLQAEHREISDCRATSNHKTIDKKSGYFRPSSRNIFLLLPLFGERSGGHPQHPISRSFKIALMRRYGTCLSDTMSTTDRSSDRPRAARCLVQYLADIGPIVMGKNIPHNLSVTPYDNAHHEWRCGWNMLRRTSLIPCISGVPISTKSLRLVSRLIAIMTDFLFASYRSPDNLQWFELSAEVNVLRNLSRHWRVPSDLRWKRIIMQNDLRQSLYSVQR